MDAEFRKLANAPAWASTATATDTLDPASATPPIVRTNGLGSAYSLPGGTQIEYNVMNQLLLELSSAAKEIVNGVSEWHVQVPYRIGSVTKRRGQLYICLQDNTGFQPGSAATHWRPIGQTTGVAPDRPTDPAWSNAKALSLTLDWRNGEDNGGLITYRLRWRKVGSTSYSSWTTLTYARNEWTSLEAGDRLDVQVQASNGVDWSSSMTTITPAALAVRTTAPAGGAAIGLLAKAGDAQATLTWTTPDNDGGSPITAYIVQWKTPTGSYSNANQATLGVVNTYTRTGLTNGTTYTFRVAARNAIGTGEWSNESDALPSATPSVGDFGTLHAPDLSRYTPVDDLDHQLRIYGTANIVPNPNAPTLNITSIQWYYRKDGERAWSIQTTSPSNQFALIGATTGWWNVRYRAVTNDNQRSGFSSVSRIEVGLEEPPPPKISLSYNKSTNTLTATPQLTGDGGRRVTRLDLRYEFTNQRSGEEERIVLTRKTIFEFHAQRPQPTSYDIGTLNRLLRSVARAGGTGNLHMSWFPSVRSRFDPNPKVSVWVAATNGQGQGDWVESNTLSWEDFD